MAGSRAVAGGALRLLLAVRVTPSEPHAGEREAVASGCDALGAVLAAIGTGRVALPAVTEPGTRCASLAGVADQSHVPGVCGLVSPVRATGTESVRKVALGAGDLTVEGTFVQVRCACQGLSCAALPGTTATLFS